MDGVKGTKKAKMITYNYKNYCIYLKLTLNKQQCLFRFRFGGKFKYERRDSGARSGWD
jgi:hypothetical protein